MRLGCISYINSLPVDMGLLEGKIPLPGAEFVSGFPSELNQKIAANQVDVGPVSAFWYAQQPELFYVLPDLSISSESGVRSVLLFSRYSLKELAGKRIAITGQGKTTPALLEVISRSFYGFSPQLVFAEKQADPLTNADAFVVIGNEALLMRQKYAASPLIVTDLAEEWRLRTGLPFVFAVWVVRRDFFREHSQEAIRAFTALIASKHWGQTHLSEVLTRAQSVTGLTFDVLQDYFSCLSYNFDAPLQKAMLRFFEEATRLQLLLQVPALEFIPDTAGMRTHSILAGKP